MVNLSTEGSHAHVSNFKCVVRGLRAGELTRLNDVSAEATTAEATLNRSITGDIAAINEAMKGVPAIK